MRRTLFDMNKEFITRIYSDEYKSIVVQAIKRTCSDISESDSDDCVSDVYLTALGTAGLDTHPDIKGWLYNVARNIAKRYRKRQGFLKVKQFNETISVEVASEIDVAEIVENRMCGEKSELLTLLQRNLKVSEYTLFKMKYIDGKSNNEIADFIGIKTHSVDVKITRLHEKIKEVLEGTKYERASSPSKLKRCAVLLTIIVVAAMLAQGVAMALGYDLIDMIWKAIRGEGNTATDDVGNEVVFTQETRFYNSMEELLETENLDILFPAELPEGYKFTHFEVISSDDDFRVIISATEPYISFVILMGTNITIDDCSHEFNGIRYNIIERDGFYQAELVLGTDYYTIAVSDESALSEIIENLKRK